MKTVLLCPFDPVTQEELDFAREQLRELRLQEIYLMPWGKGKYSLQERVDVLKVALQSHHRLQICTSIEKEDHILEFENSEESEKAVQQGDFTKTSDAVRRYLCKKGMYYTDIAKYMCKPSRYVHSVSVAKTAVEIAGAHGVDCDLAYKAGILHDITKAYAYDQSRKIIELYKPEWLSVSEKVWHSYTAVIYLKQHLQYVEEEVLHAIEHHTLGDGNTDLDAILYIADKIEPGRGYDTTYQMKLARTNLKQAVDYIRQDSLRYRLEKEGKHV